ncbi:S-methyl-5'-thioinosine phosphorylase [Hydrogenophilus thiooxidans]|uniref:S-methyl-5'-thioinosine phosphorylase n=1 Tax=Hydrogenophilus thiooxidans TaxID=2820326 RepID=UPI001C215D3D|nr:S-methyl-5'-thioinosine phosphorylase [Hydrogenophilus thiooxidans]
MLAVIGGSGLSNLTNLERLGQRVVRTPYGEPSGVLTFGRLGCEEIVFIARHGYGHTIAPHRINYRANLWALKHVGATRVIAVASVGGIAPRFSPGTLVVPHQIIDYTWGRVSTFYDGPDDPVVHIDFTQPFTPALREALLHAAAMCHEPVLDGAVYACTQGPRLETAAEIERLARDGADLVGMTLMPEAVLAREIGLEYAALNVVANWAAGRGDAKERIAFDALQRELERSIDRAKRILEAFCHLCAPSTQ